MSEDLIQAPSATDKPSGDHPGSEFEARARDIMDEACLGEPFVRNGVDAALRRTISTALAEAVADEREACAKIAEEYFWRLEIQAHPTSPLATDCRHIAASVRSRGDVKC